jgi:excisionase family DNA binding protein
MAQLTLGQAARLANVGKTTLARAIKSGKLSATRREDGGYLIDPAELQRVYTIPSETPETPSQSVPAVHHATPAVTPDVTARVAALEAELDGLKALLAEVRQTRDDWKEQAARLALSGPVGNERERGWWPWRKRA